MKRISRSGFITLLALLLLAASVLSLTLTIRVGRTTDQLETLTQGVKDELESQRELTVRLSSNQRQATSNLQEVRGLLNLPQGTYQFTESAMEDATRSSAETAEEVLTIATLQAAISRIDDARRRETLHAQLNDALPARIAEEGDFASLRVRTIGTLRWELTKREPPTATDPPYLLRIRATPREWILEREGLSSQTIPSPENNDERLEALITAIYTELPVVSEGIARYKEAVSSIRSFLRSDPFREEMSRVGLTLGREELSHQRYLQPLVGSRNSETAFTVEVHHTPFAITIDQTEVAEVELAVPHIQERLRRTDPRTATQIATDRAVNELQALHDAPRWAPFRDALSQRQLRLSSQIREGLDFFYLDLLDSNDERFGAFAVQKERGTIYITDRVDVVITTLQNASRATASYERAPLSSSGNRALPADFPPGFLPATVNDGLNLLLIGSHENKADAMILAHLTPEKTVSLISIPRDLWWQQRKLSYHLQVYGYPHLVQQLERITAQKIDGWVAVDMYAFIEVVDLLGGIDITLNEPLIDPTYRVREGGEWGTLYYEAGSHHVGGVEALRLARSRHTSNDFERSTRQQMILTALRDRLNQLHAGDLAKVYELIGVINRYVDTSFSAWELAQLFLNYRQAEVTRQTGLTFDNVLYNTWSNLHLQNLSYDEVDEDFFLGQWILLPREDNWQVIPWFIQRNLR